MLDLIISSKPLENKIVIVAEYLNRNYIFLRILAEKMFGILRKVCVRVMRFILMCIFCWLTGLFPVLIYLLTNSNYSLLMLTVSLTADLFRDNPRNFNFDNIFSAMLCLFEVLTLKSWYEIRDVIMKQTGDVSPVKIPFFTY